MRPISRVHLARQLTAQIVDAACDGMGEQWSAWEAAHAAAPTNEAKAAAAAPALVLCRRGCPEVQLCAERARVDSYTGLAAGDAWTDGVSDSEKAEKALRRRLAQPVGSERRAG